MLSFTHNTQKSQNPYQLQPQQYQPLTLTNTTGRPHLMPAPEYPKKKITKSHSNSKVQKVGNKIERHHLQTEKQQNKPWNSETVTRNDGVFDRNMKKDSLAAQERQIRANSRVQQNARFRDRDDGGHSGKIISKEEAIHKKKIDIVSQEQERQILKLKQLIEKQRLQKQKNDLQYEAKKKKIEQQRKQLIQIQRQIQRQGPKAIKQLKQKIHTHSPPSHDKVHLKQTLNQQNPQKLQQQLSNNYTELTQSESLANQKNKFRQQQLAYLVDQRQKNYKQYQKNTLGYTPTLLPLLSKASYKIISTHISSLVELLIDDMLEEQVYLLEAIELEAQAGKAQQREKEMLHDYVNKLENFVQETENIEEKLGKYSQMRFEDIYKPVRKLREQKHAFVYEPSLYNKLELNLGADDLEEIQHRIGRFKRYVSSFDQYKNANIDMFRKVTEQCIDEAIEKLAKELDNGAGQFVNIVFRNQFN